VRANEAIVTARGPHAPNPSSRKIAAKTSPLRKILFNSAAYTEKILDGHDLCHP